MLQNSFRVYILLLLFIILGCNRGGNILMVGGISGPNEVPEGTTVEYSVDAESSTGFTYNWVVNPVGFGTLGSPTAASTTFTAPDVDSDFEIVIRVVVNYKSNGPVVRSLDVTVRDITDPENPDDPPDDDPPVNHPPAAAAHVDDHEISAGDYLQFFDDSTDPDGNDDIVKWEWDFSFDPDDGFNVESTEIEPLVEFLQPGIFDVQLRVTDSTGLSDMLDEPLLITIIDDYPAAWYGFTFGADLNFDKAIGIGVDPEGRVYVAGEFIHTVDFDPGEDVHEMTATVRSGYMVKYNQYNFHVLDSTQWDGSELKDFDGVTVEGFTSDSNGNFCVTGNYGRYPGLYGAHGDYGGSFIKSITSTNLNNWMINKVNQYYYDFWLDEEYFHYYEFSPVAFGNEGDIYFIDFLNAGGVDGSSTLMKKPLAGQTVTLAELPQYGEYNSVGASQNGIVTTLIEPYSDGFIRDYNLIGVKIWEISPVIVPTESHTKIRSDAAGNFYLLGINYQNITKVTYYGAISMELSWDAEVSDIYVNDNGSFIVTGIFTETVDFDPGPGEALKSSPGSTSGYVSAFDSYGNFQWVETWGNSEDMSVRGICADNSGNIYVCGYFTDTIDLGPPWQSDIHYSNGGRDAFVLKLSQ